MLATDEDAVVCDFAETYHVYDLWQLPCEYAATLAAGLRNDSRIKVKQSGLGISPELFALAVAADKLGTLVWFQTKDGRKGRNRPPSLTKLLSGERKKDDNNLRSFESGEDFMAEWKRLTGEEGKHAGTG